jgi:hypothetical protein
MRPALRTNLDRILAADFTSGPQVTDVYGLRAGIGCEGILSSIRIASGLLDGSIARYRPNDLTLLFWNRASPTDTRSPLARFDSPWKVLVADVESVKRHPANSESAVTAVTSGNMPVDPILQNPGGIELHWAADDTLLFMSYRDCFPHLYSLQHPGSAGKPPFMIQLDRLPL